MQALFSTHAARALLPGPEGSPELRAAAGAAAASTLTGDSGVQYTGLRTGVSGPHCQDGACTMLRRSLCSEKMRSSMIPGLPCRTMPTEEEEEERDARRWCAAQASARVRVA